MMEPEDSYEEVPKPILGKRKPQNRKTKTFVIFDEEARRNYLTGFHKRKQERRKKAKEENEKKVKDERQALKQKVRDMIRKSDSHIIPELEHLLDSKVYNLPDHTVTVTDVSEVDLSKRVAKGANDDSDQETPREKEDAEALKKKQKKLRHKLAEVGNPSSKKKVKRLGKGKFKGGGKSKFKGKDRFQNTQHGRPKSKNKYSSKKQRHK